MISLRRIQALSRFEKAVREHEMKGVNDPEDHDLIDAEYKTAKKALEKMLETKK